MRFAYYIPQLAYNDATPERLAELGLSDRFRDCFGREIDLHLARTQVIARGPDNGAGAWLYAKDGNKDALKWEPGGSWESQLSDNGKFYLCWKKGEKAEPEDLKRRKIVEGQGVELLDGNVWHCPTIRTRLAIPNVPCSYERKSGDVVRQVIPSYREVWEASGKWAASYFGSGLSESEMFDIAATCVALNYRVGDEELRLLSLFDLDAMRQVLRVAIDFDAVREFLIAQNPEEEEQKKSAPESGSEGDTSSSPGAAA